MIVVNTMRGRQKEMRFRVNCQFCDEPIVREMEVLVHVSVVIHAMADNFKHMVQWHPELMRELLNTESEIEQDRVIYDNNLPDYKWGRARP